MNDTELERRMAQLLTASVRGGARVDAASVTDLVIRRAGRDRRRRTVAAVAAAVVVAAAAVTVPAVLGARSTEAPPAATPSPSPTSSVRPSPLTDAQAAAWVAGLPRGDDADRPVISGDTYGLLTIEHSGGFTGAEDYAARLLVAGRVVGEGDPMGSALSPDGARLALGFATLAGPTAQPEVTLLLIDTDSGRELARARPNRPGLAVVGWADSGIVLTDYGQRQQPMEVLLWAPESNPPTVMPVAAGIAVDVAETADSVLAQDSATSSCVRALELPSGRERAGCDERGLVAISDDGTLGLTGFLEVVRIGSTAPHQQLDIPAGFQASTGFAADGRAVLGLPDGSVVACPVDGGTCRRFDAQGQPAAAPLCDRSTLVPATQDGRRDPVGQVDTEGAGGRLARFVYVTTTSQEPCTLSGYPTLADHSSRPTGLLAEHGTFFDSSRGTPAVIRAGTAAVVVVEATTSPEACPGQSAKTFSDPRLELGNGTAIPLGSLTTYCPVRVSAWHNLPN